MMILELAYQRVRSVRFGSLFILVMEIDDNYLVPCYLIKIEQKLRV